jgi:hypothetical protein
VLPESEAGGDPPRIFDLHQETTVFVFIGDPQDALREDREVAAYYDRVLGEVQRLERDLKCRVEEVLDLAGGWSPDTLRKLMDGSRFETLAARTRSWDPSLLETRQTARDAWYATGLVEGGVFREDRWRHFLDVEWRPAIRALREAHAQRGQEKYTDASSRFGMILGTLLEESYNLSRFVVYPPWVPKHENDYYADEEGTGDLQRLEIILRDNYEQLQKYRRLGGG